MPIPDETQAPTELDREVSADAKCLACGLPSVRMDLCDRWNCPYLMLRKPAAAGQYVHNQGAVEEALRERHYSWDMDR